MPLLQVEEQLQLHPLWSTEPGRLEIRRKSGVGGVAQVRCHCCVRVILIFLWLLPLLLLLHPVISVFTLIFRVLRGGWSQLTWTPILQTDRQTDIYPLECVSVRTSSDPNHVGVPVFSEEHDCSRTLVIFVFISACCIFIVPFSLMVSPQEALKSH